MSKTLNWAIRDKIHLMKEHDRFTALVYLVLRSNLHFRAWPSNELTTKDTGMGDVYTSHAYQWLEQQGAVILVPYTLRMAEEKHLAVRKKVYQLTGLIKLEDEWVEYLFLQPPDWNTISNHAEDIHKLSPFELSLYESLQGKRLQSEYEGSKALEGVQVVKGLKSSAPKNGATPKDKISPSTDLIKAWWDAIPSRPATVKNPYAVKAYREYADTLLEQGVTVADIQTFVAEKASETFYADKVIAWKTVADNIGMWRQSQNGHSTDNGKPAPSEAIQRTTEYLLKERQSPMPQHIEIVNDTPISFGGSD